MEHENIERGSLTPKKSESGDGPLYKPYMEESQAGSSLTKDQPEELMIFGKRPRIAITPPRGRSGSFPRAKTEETASNAGAAIETSKEVEFFGKRSRLRRTPPGGGAESVDSGSGEDRPTKKKKEAVEPGKRTMRFKAAELIRKLDKELSALNRIVKENRNTKVEIKDLNEKLSSTISKLVSKQYLDILEDVTPASEVAVIPGRSEVATQTDFSDVQSKEEEDKMCRKEVVEVLEREEGYASLKSLIEKNWTEGAYVNTEIVGSSIVKEVTTDIAVVVDPTDIGERGLLGRLKGQNPQMVKLLNGSGIGPGKVGFVKTGVGTILTGDGGDEEEKAERYIYIIGKGVTKDAEEQLYNGLVSVVKRTGVRNRSQLAVAGIDIQKNVLRKLIECVTYKMDIKVAIHELPDRKKYKSRDAQQQYQFQMARGRRKAETVIIEADEGVEGELQGGKDKLYSEMLKNLKKDIKIDDIGIGVKAIGKSNKGGIKLQVVGKNGWKEKFKEAVMTSTNHKARIKIIANRKETIMLTGIDETITEKEIIEEVRSVADGNLTTEEVQAHIARTGRSLTAFVSLPMDSAQKILNIGKLRVGWIDCKVREKITPVKCFKCLEYGHIARNCAKKVPVVERCYRCGKEGHKKLECKETALSCYVCKQEGHRADHAACPKYKEAIKAILDHKRGRRNGETLK